MAAVEKTTHQVSQKEGALISRRVLYGAGYCVLVVMTAYSAVVVKESRQALPLISVQTVAVDANEEVVAEPGPGAGELKPGEYGPPLRPAKFVPIAEPVVKPAKIQTPRSQSGVTAETRWFNGRPVRPAKVVQMLVTGYSPDARSCGESADGLTATMHSVETNAFRLVAADPTVLPYGSMLSVPGYASELIVPVLDCGGMIKGNRLDLLFRTHEEAMKWGVKHVNVTIWEYADGKPAENPRAMR